MQVQQTSYSIKTIVDRIKKGKMGLPEFQRDFVWSPTQTSDLLNSIAKNWPIGTLLLLEGPQPFAFRSVDKAPPIAHNDLSMYILDGQQRVTAIYHAIADVSDYIFYINFNSIDPHIPPQEPVEFSKRSTFLRSHPKIQDRATAGIATCAEIFDNEMFNEWISHVEVEKQNTYRRVRDRHLSGLGSHYLLYAMELDEDIELEALAKIFETINKTGIRLNAFDLLVAKMYPSGFNLKIKWQEARDELPILQSMEVDGLEIIKFISLIIRQNEGKRSATGVRQGDILKISPDFISAEWHKAVRSYAKALDKIKEFGIINSALVPNWSMVSLIACAIHFNFPINLKRWWVNSILLQRFAQSANTRTLSEFDRFRENSFEVDSELLPEPNQIIEILHSKARTNGILLRGIAGLMIASGAKDPVTNQVFQPEDKLAFVETAEKGLFKVLSQEGTIMDLYIARQRSLPELRRHSDLLPPNIDFSSQGSSLRSNSRENYFLDIIA